MRTVVRALIGALLLATVPATPVRASGAVVLRCEIRYLIGFGSVSGQGDCQVNGVVNNSPVADGRTHATFTAYSPPDNLCALDTATGTMTGALDVDFNWSRFGSIVLVTTTGDINGFGVGELVPGGVCGSFEHLAEITLVGL